MGKLSKFYELMKTFLTLIFLFFSSSVVADDISDFQIEGISVGDSLLDYFSFFQIKDKTKSTKYKNKKYVKVVFHKSKFNFINFYDALAIYIIANDNNYIVSSISGAKIYENINECNNQRDQIFESIIEQFNDMEINDNGLRNHSLDNTGESTTNAIFFNLKVGGSGSVGCVDFSKKFEDNGAKDHLRITMSNKEYRTWLDTEAYK